MLVGVKKKKPIYEPPVGQAQSLQRWCWVAYTIPIPVPPICTDMHVGLNYETSHPHRWLV